MNQFSIGPVNVEVLGDEHVVQLVPPSQWHGDRAPRSARATLANIRANDGLRAQVTLATWLDSDEVSLGFAEVMAGPSDYERLENAGVMSPKIIDGDLVARLAALRKGAQGRYTLAGTTWEQLDRWAGEDAQAMLQRMGAIATGDFGALNPAATRFKQEPAVSVSTQNPAPLFAAYVMTRVMPIMLGHGDGRIEGPHA